MCDDAYDSIYSADHKQLDAMRRDWRDGAADDELRHRIINLRLIYDWPALKSMVRICPNSSTAKFRLNDLFNILDMHIPVGFGVRAPARYEPSISMYITGIAAPKMSVNSSYTT